MITFQKVDDITTTEQKTNIWDWCKDHAEHFGAIPLEYAEWNEKKGEDDVLDYNQLLSALTQDQLDEIEYIIVRNEQDLESKPTKIIEVKNTNIGRMTFADRNTELTVNVISKFLKPLLETIYEDVEIISVNKAAMTLRFIVNGNVVKFSYDIVTASRNDDPHGFRLRGKI
ncbi:hypothetical protein [Pseudoalteromonas marina]|uniref:Uncharacterized protein n=1 Tax=Pseudoalteromonas marina TaxID=267375 RepID=A0ABT9FI56_9GAMM|nr:hypothetical protein [Pseudoalteromonas marina]MDP2566468.1 hypothetical protein [Pseudoalteromonas marina]